METKQIEINGIDFLVKIHHEKRRNCRVSIRRNIINIRVSQLLTRKEQDRQMEKLMEWAIDHIRKHPDKFKPVAHRKYTDGEIFLTNSKKYQINIVEKNKKHSSASLKDDIIFLFLSNHLSEAERNEHMSTLVSRCIASEQLPKLKKRIYELNDRYFNKEINNIYFKHNVSNWGSCSERGNINISTRLVFAPDDVVDYVCIHELAHLIEPNHSDRFWQLVSKAMPDYKEKIQWLKDNTDSCRF